IQQVGAYFKANAAKNKQDNGGRPEEGSAAHLAAHAILAAAVAAAGGNDPLSAGIAAAGTEAVIPVVSQWLFGTKDSSKLSAEEKETLSSIGGLIGAGVGAASGEGTADIVSGSQAAQNAVVNNHVFLDKVQEKIQNGTQSVADFVRDNLGEGTASLVTNAAINVVGGAAEGSVGKANHLVDGALVVVTCATGLDYCQQALTDTQNKNSEIYQSIASLMNGDSWQEISMLAQQAKQGDQLAAEQLAAMVAAQLTLKNGAKGSNSKGNGSRNTTSNKDTTTENKNSNSEKQDSYVSSPKHEKGGSGTRMDLNNNEAQKLFEEATSLGKQKYGFKDGKIYEFQPDGTGGYHGYPIPPNELITQQGGANILRQWLKEGKITNSQYNKLINNKPI
uniref:VENN motif pre-toxin domain-containing protein n=1 Tax=Stenoxybacter acetivorans TaxID=422441 RepID=UPI00055A8557